MVTVATFYDSKGNEVLVLDFSLDAEDEMRIFREVDRYLAHRFVETVLEDGSPMNIDLERATREIQQGLKDILPRVYRPDVVKAIKYYLLRILQEYRSMNLSEGVDDN